MIETTALYAIPLTLTLVVLGVRVSILRGKTGISILHGDNMRLAERMRAHGNFAESVPLSLILMGVAEMLGASDFALHSIGVLLVVSRLLHVYGLNHENPAAPLRVLGGVGSDIVQLTLVALIAWQLI